MNLPFTNIRQVLSLHNKVSPEKIFLTVITDKGREELSYAEFSARCHQTANFLQEDLGIKPGDVVAIDDKQADYMAVVLVACWLIGAMCTKTFEEHAKVYFCRYTNWDLFQLTSELAHSHNSPLIVLGDEPSHYPHFDTLVRGMPTTFFNEYREPTLDMPAYLSQSDDTKSREIFSQGLLLDTAQDLASSQMITGNQRLISYMELGSNNYSHEVTLNTLSLFVAALLVGGSLIIDTRFYPRVQPEIFWREVAASRLHIACVSIRNIQNLISFARKQQTAGKPIYGEGVYQQDIKQLRHIYCPDAKGHDDLIKQFTDMFPFPVVTNS